MMADLAPSRHQGASTPGGALAAVRDDATAAAMLERWLELSELERRAFLAMTRELAGCSASVEDATLDLTRRFRALAEGAEAQAARVESVIAMAQSIEIGEETMVLGDATAFINTVLARVIDTVLAVSKNAMRMVFALDDVTKEVEEAEKSIGQLNKINQATRFLALNAAIEAARAGVNGGPFQVIAHEIKELSNETAETAKLVSGRINGIAGSVRRSHTVLREIATMDMSEHIVAKERMDALLAGMTKQNVEFSGILAETSSSTQTLSRTISGLVMGMQFQDRTSQHIAHVIEALETLAAARDALRDETAAALPGRFDIDGIDRELLARIIDKQTLGAVRQRFLAQLLDDRAEVVAPVDTPVTLATDVAGEIELF